MLHSRSMKIEKLKKKKKTVDWDRTKNIRQSKWADVQIVNNRGNKKAAAMRK